MRVPGLEPRLPAEPTMESRRQSVEQLLEYSRSRKKKLSASEMLSNQRPLPMPFVLERLMHE